MNILLVYTTNSGGTQIAAETVKNKLDAAGHTVTMKNPKEVESTDIETNDAVIFGSPSYDYAGKEGQPHEDYLALFEKMKGKKAAGKPSAVFCLGDSSYAVFCGAADHLEAFVHGFGGKLVLPTLRIDGFYFDQGGNEAKVVKWADQVCSSLSVRV